MRISSDDQKAIGLILVCLGFLFFLIGLGARLKEGFECRCKIEIASFAAAATATALGLMIILLSWGKRRS